MGVVYKAKHTRLNRIVALKVISQGRLSQNSDAVRRFLREAQAAAQLFHPNVVIVFDSNQAGDTYFIAMEYVDGIDLYKLVKDNGPLPVEQACDYIRQAAQGLQHAHECGLVHRDIKPPNLLVTNPRGPQRGGVVKILDMGLALVTHTCENSVQFTSQGALMGTPDYIAPEQAVDSHGVDIRSDLYSLGCTFYYLLTGKAPFGDYSLMKKLMMHQTVDARPVQELRPEVSSALGAIIRKLLAKRPDDRYATPADLIDALASLTAPPTVPDLRVTSPGMSVNIPDRADVKSDPSQDTAAQAAASTQEVELPPSTEHLKKVAVLEGHRGWVTAVAFSADRKVMMSGGVDGCIFRWDMSSSKACDKALPQAHAGDVGAIAMAADRRLMASASASLGGRIALWDYTGDEPHPLATTPARDTSVEALVFSRDSALLAGGGSDRAIRVWETAQDGLALKYVLKGHGSNIKALAFASDHHRIASGSQDGTVRLWNLAKFWSREQAVLEENWGPVRTVAFGPDDKLLAFGCLDQTVRLWDISGLTPEPYAVLRGHAGVVRLVFFNRDGQTLLSVCDGGRIIRWNVAKAAMEREWLLPRAEVHGSLCFTHDGRYFAAGDSEGSATIFRLYPRRDRNSSS
jgi:serine/threonine protein kinase